MTEQVKEELQRPTRLDLAVLPRDPQRVLGSLRQNVCASFNYCRQYPAKLAVLNETLTAALKHIRAEMKYQEEVAKQEELKQTTIQANAE